MAIVWANLAYLLVSLPLLFRRLHGWPRNLPVEAEAAGASGATRPFALGRWGLILNLVSVCWGLMMIINIELAPGRDLRLAPMGTARRGAGHSRAGRRRSGSLSGLEGEKLRDPDRARGEHRHGDRL